MNLIHSRGTSANKAEPTIILPPHANVCLRNSIKAYDRRSVLKLGYGLQDSDFEYRQRQESCLFSKMSRTALRPTQPPIQGVPGLFCGLKGRGVNVTD